MLVHMWLQDQAPTQSVLQLLSYNYYIFEEARQSEGKAKLLKPTEYKEGTSIQESVSETFWADAGALTFPLLRIHIYMVSLELWWNCWST